MKPLFATLALSLAFLGLTCLPLNARAAAPEAAANTGKKMPDVKVKATYGDWQLKCIGDSKECQIYQLLKDPDGRPIVEVSLFKLPDGQPAVAGANLIAPLETLLTEEVTIEFEKDNAKKYPYSFCLKIGCVSRIGFTKDEIETFKANADAKIYIVHIGDPAHPIKLSLSLKGFTKAWKSL